MTAPTLHQFNVVFKVNVTLQAATPSDAADEAAFELGACLDHARHPIEYTQQTVEDEGEIEK